MPWQLDALNSHMRSFYDRTARTWEFYKVAAAFMRAIAITLCYITATSIYLLAALLWQVFAVSEDTAVKSQNAYEIILRSKVPTNNPTLFTA